MEGETSMKPQHSVLKRRTKRKGLFKQGKGTMK
jgi:hypothetical protein